jgi:hypothetical protein
MRNYLAIKRTFIVASLVLIPWGLLQLTHAADQRGARIPEISAEQPSTHREAPAREVSPGQGMWVDEIRNALEIFKGNYRTSNFEPYLNKLSLVGDALGQEDHRRVQVEIGSFFQMLSKRAYGINAGAADDLSNFARKVMPAQEYGIIFPKNDTEPYPFVSRTSQKAT